MTSEFVFFENEKYSEFVKTTAGAAFRLFPFGVLYKNGKRREITPEYAAQFKLPHFKPPIKLGSHDERTPAGGQIVALEVREDGLYAVPEFTEQGQNSLTNGDYRYHSPEVIWEGDLEDPTSGKPITGPLIVGDALLHTPHLGEAAALYSVEINSKKEVDSMTDEMVSVPKSLFDRFLALFDKRTTEPAPVAETETNAAQTVELDQFEALKKERDEYAAKLQAIEDEKAKAARVDSFTAALKETKVADGAEMLASMSDQQAEWVLTQFKALSAKVDTSALFSEKGSGGEGITDPSQALHAAVTAKMEEKNVDYNAALALVQAETPELLAAVYSKKGGK